MYEISIFKNIEEQTLLHSIDLFQNRWGAMNVDHAFNVLIVL